MQEPPQWIVDRESFKLLPRPERYVELFWILPTSTATAEELLNQEHECRRWNHLSIAAVVGSFAQFAGPFVMLPFDENSTLWGIIWTVGTGVMLASILVAQQANEGCARFYSSSYPRDEIAPMLPYHVAYLRYLDLHSLQTSGPPKQTP